MCPEIAMTERAESRAFRYAWVAMGVILFFVLWLPASWLAGLIVPVDWPTEPVSGREAVERLTGQVNVNYWVSFGIWVVLWVVVAGTAEAARRRWRRQHRQAATYSAVPGTHAPPG
jgi:hypothetical protein